MIVDIFAVIPILILLIFLLLFKLPARKAGAISFLTATGISLWVFQLPLEGMVVALGKGFSLSLFVLLIIWAAVFLYNLVNEAGAIEVISRNLTLVIEDKFVQFLLLSWVFSSFLQGIAGFGVPVAIVTPILVKLGFNPFASVAAVLLGHSWSISFGSMGSSFYTIGLVTGLPSSDLAFWMSLYTSVAMLFTGFGVCYIYGGFQAITKGVPYILSTTVVMVGSMFIITYLQMMSVVSLLTALVGLVFLFFVYRKLVVPTKENYDSGINFYRGKLNLLESILPYGLIIILSVLFQLSPIQGPELNFDFPGFETGLGYIVTEELQYVTIDLLTHPAPIILISSLAGIFVYNSKQILSRTEISQVVNKTVEKCTGTTLTLTWLICMALLMMDSGMIENMAHNVANLTGQFYPIFAPFFGVLGSFITGSNTNSNVIFGSFQATVATTLGVSPAIMAAVQSIGGSVGCSIGPTQVLLGTSSVNLNGKEAYIYGRIIHITLLIAVILGMVNWVLLNTL
ncbi:L-lactate permease [Natranaerobius thermophilus]|uniref:L-lactate permease n=1 Tax=Natranaerobius thermophilus (strain ATCC BAA-1301 / DSM 18059 / JW/NM-WN-LF) TaxID=457570 RepID=B2A3D0_NATTJ|nr:L-lactate permease [Natranaerobius thermophilus]ACB86359.1 L-lactate permease [Natranaerobius thermophilus JW/NM-WN-LF]